EPGRLPCHLSDSRLPTPPVNAVLEGSPGTACRCRRRVGRRWLAEQNRTEAPQPIRNAQCRVQGLLAAEVAEERSSNAPVGGAEEQSHDGKGDVDEPVGDQPFDLPGIGSGLV